jgi:ABC-type nitrate/sulfonate/bicarbonate transport system substrate-binding protein
MFFKPTNSRFVGNLSQRFSRAIFCIALTMAIGCFGNSPIALAATASTPIVLQLLRQPEIATAGAIMASKAGLFDREGLTVRIEKIEDGNSRLEDPSAAIVIRLEDAQQALLDRARGLPVVAFAGNYIDSTVALFSRRERKIRSLDDLSGKSIGYDPRSDTGLIFEWLLDKNPDFSRSHISEKTDNPGWKAISDNTLDVLVGHVGIDDALLGNAGVAIETLDPREYGVHALGTVYVADQAAIEKNPALFIGFLRALIAGWDLVYDKPDQAIPAIESAGDGGSRILPVKTALRLQRPFLRPGAGRFGEIPQHKWTELQTFMLQRRMLKSPMDLKKATNTDLIAEAYRNYQQRPSER